MFCVDAGLMAVCEAIFIYLYNVCMYNIYIKNQLTFAIYYGYNDSSTVYQQILATKLQRSLKQANLFHTLFNLRIQKYNSHTITIVYTDILYSLCYDIHDLYSVGPVNNSLRLRGTFWRNEYTEIDTSFQKNPVQFIISFRNNFKINHSRINCMYNNIELSLHPYELSYRFTVNYT